jgi:hypothetical protein
MLETLVPGVLSILLAAGLVAPVVLKVNSIPLWIVAAIGFGLMIATFVEAIRHERARD